MLGYQAAPTVVGRLRVRANGQDSLLTRLRLGRLLDPIELRPRRLPSSAILYVRTLRDPLPGTLRLENGNVRPPPAWQEALGATLDRLASKACRPSREAVPPDAEAVVFVDASELLSCLASDWSEGSLMTRWWWQSLLKQGATAQVVKELWRRDSQYVPAALQQLASRNKAADFVRALSDAEVSELLRGVAQSFGLPALVRVLDDFKTAAAADRKSDLNQPRTTAGRSRVHAATAPSGPWRPWVPECRAAELRPEQEFFFGIALLLARAPARARAPEFQARVREWQRQISSARAGELAALDNAAGQAARARQQPSAEASAERLYVVSADQSASDARAGARFQPLPRSPREAEREPDGPDATARATLVGESSDVVKADQTLGELPQAQPVPAEFQPQASETAEASASQSPASAKSRYETTTRTDWRAGDSLAPEPSSQPPAILEPASAVSDLPVAAQDASPAPQDVLLALDENQSPSPSTALAWFEQTEEWFETQLGGVFYLINLGLALGFYGDFTTPDEPGIQLNIWDFVALLACELAGDDVPSDPVWPLLRQLAQREEGDLVGGDFDPETVAGFAARFANPGLSPAPNADHPETENPKSEARDAQLETSAAVAAWVHRLLPYVRMRLRQALGLAETDDPGPLVCRQRARICLTPTHLDVFFSLAELPIAIRFAGLDRNPGWVPAAGRFIAFHFE